MKKETIQKRLERLQCNKNCSAYKLITEWLKSENNPLIRPCWHSGRGRFTTNLDYTAQTINLLKSLRVRYEIGNDAPRGGKYGNYIRVLL